MPKMNVAFALDATELKRFDDWRGEIPRGTALVWLMDFADENSAPPPGTPPSRIAAAFGQLERAESGENAGAFDVTTEPTPQILKKKDPLDQSPDWDDSYAQDPPQDDGDQRAKRRGK